MTLRVYKKMEGIQKSQIFKKIRIVDYYFKKGGNQTRQQEAENLRIVF